MKKIAQLLEDYNLHLRAQLLLLLIPVIRNQQKNERKPFVWKVQKGYPYDVR